MRNIRDKSNGVNQTSVIYMNDKKKFSDMARFIKRLGDERVTCQVYIRIDNLLVESPEGVAKSKNGRGQDDLYAL